ncbi:radical SAM protein [Paraflavitalea sp. CAU 1676]|uniref:B12-binding domain-containing radical SAM protein n=1 Tax=Paraflavitalea sp. CAU 1676 TaxID=3032598 RepID=UPI0023DAFF87|nr:radical SAM protein [Paraflavitalea sp. CAU 1676]MDF2189536.1 radical SAM protein [Paraflavitalea sp. CAU 1676]
MKKLLFSHSYFLRYDPKQWDTGQPYAPLGTLYAASLLREHGYAVSLFDTMFAQGPDEVLPLLENFRPDVFVLYDDGFNYLTKMCLTNMREAAFRMSKLARQQGCTVIVCSSDSTDHFAQYLDEGADYIILGEGEMTLLELVQALDTPGTSITSIPGLAYREKGTDVKTGKRPVMKDLDSLPLPAWDLVNMAPYRAMWQKSTGYFSMNVATTRGCPFKCNWCAKPIYGNRYNSRSPQHVVQELKLLKERYQFDYIWFCDDIFGLKPGWVQEFASLTEQEQLPLRFKIQSRADLLVQENYIRSLARAGCENAWMGAESGSQQILDAMDKGTTIEQIHQATGLLKQHGIRPSFFIQFGYPGETQEDIRKTINMIRQLMPAELGISVSYPLPGTVFYERVKNDLKAKSNWADSDELQLMFRNTYPPAFYKKLHRHVHHVYRTWQGWAAFRQAIRNPFAVKLSDIKKVAAACLYLPRTFIGRWQLKKLSYE